MSPRMDMSNSHMANRRPRVAVGKENKKKLSFLDTSRNTNSRRVALALTRLHSVSTM